MSVRLLGDVYLSDNEYINPHRKPMSNGQCKTLKYLARGAVAIRMCIYAILSMTLYPSNSGPFVGRISFWGLSLRFLTFRFCDTATSAHRIKTYEVKLVALLIENR